MNFRRLSLRARLGLIAMLPLVTGGAVLATGQAAAAAPTCPSGEVCLYDGLNASVPRATYRVGDANMAVGAPLFNDRMESWQNNSGRRFCWYSAINYGGRSYVMEPYGQRVVNLLPSERNTASSLRAC